MAMCLCGMPAEFQCQLHPDGLSQECRTPDRVPLYGYIEMAFQGLYVLVLVRDEPAALARGFVRVR